MISSLDEKVADLHCPLLVYHEVVVEKGELPGSITVYQKVNLLNNILRTTDPIAVAGREPRRAKNAPKWAPPRGQQAPHRFPEGGIGYLMIAVQRDEAPVRQRERIEFLQKGTLFGVDNLPIFSEG